MKQTYIYILSILFLVSCTKDFDKINTNPNSSENIDPQFLLANVISELANQNTYDQGFRLANYLAQFAASVEFERIDRYEMGTNSQYWNNLYGLLADIQSMQTVESSNDTYRAVGGILKSYIYSQLTDLWGDVPYTESLSAASGITAPKYDTQQFIYTDGQTGILATLTNAVDALENATGNIAGDVLYDGDIDQWIRFANSLKVRYYLRISNKLTDFADLQKIADNGKLFQSNADNAALPYLSAAPNQFPMSQASLGLYQEHRMTHTVDSILSSWNDPRVGVIYKPTEDSQNSGNPEYKGLLNGQSRETISAAGIDLSDISLFGAIYRDVPNGVDGQFMLYSELQFALAEAVARGFITGDAQEYYENGIRAHFDYLNVEMSDDYFLQSSVALDGSNDVEKILTQKWFSLVSNGHEAWFNVRRTGIPNLKPGPDNLNEGRYPVRYLYPESEQATNNSNYTEAAARIGGDNINSKGWWDL